jgi:preprotein translocase subunit SecE
VVKKDEPKKQTKDSIEKKETTREFKLAELVSDTREELTKIVWPSRQQLLSESLAVILMVSLVATIIYLVDNVFHWGAGKVFG